MIEYIKSNFKEGDYLSLTGSGSRINGYLAYIDDNLIVLKTLSGDIEGIKAEAIVSFSTQQREKRETKKDLRLTQQNSTKQYHQKGKDFSVPLYGDEPQRSSFKQFKPGDKIPLDELAHRDPSLAQNWRMRDENKARTQALQEKLLNILSDITIEHRQEDEQIVKPMGRIVELQPSFHFAFIDDLNDGQRYFFNKFDIIDPELRDLQGENIEVIYLRTTNKKGVAAKCVHRPAKVSQIIDRIKALVQEEELQNAKSMVEIILQAYPQNSSALALIEPFQKEDRLPGESDRHESFSEMYAYYKEGKRLAADKDYRGAIQALQTSLDSGYRKASCVKDISQAYISLYAKTEDALEREKIRTEALDFMEENQSELPENRSTLFTLENFYFALGDYNDHVDIVEQIITECGQAGDLAQYVFYLNKAAQSYLRIGEPDKALDATMQGLEVDPDHPHLLKTQHTIMEVMSNRGSDAPLQSASDEGEIPMSHSSKEL